MTQSNSAQKAKTTEDDWQIIIPVPSTNDASENDSHLIIDDDDDANSRDEFVHLNAEVGAPSTMLTTAATQAITGGIFPAARARLASLRDLGAKKIGALKLKLIENKIKLNERGKCRQLAMSKFAERRTYRILQNFATALHLQIETAST